VATLADHACRPSCKHSAQDGDVPFIHNVTLNIGAREIPGTTDDLEQSEQFKQARCKRITAGVQFAVLLNSEYYASRSRSWRSLLRCFARLS
jgi:hypothetical protein